MLTSYSHIILLHIKNLCPAKTNLVSHYWKSSQLERRNGWVILWTRIKTSFSARLVALYSHVFFSYSRRDTLYLSINFVSFTDDDKGTLLDEKTPTYSGQVCLNDFACAGFVCARNAPGVGRGAINCVISLSWPRHSRSGQHSSTQPPPTFFSPPHSFFPPLFFSAARAFRKEAWVLFTRAGSL